MKRIALSAALFLMTTTLDAQVIPFKATERTLPNGLKVIVVPTGFPNIVSIQVPVQSGSRSRASPTSSST